MIFFSGFSLHGEADFFDAFLDRGEYSVSGFSYGAIKALSHVNDLLKSSKRVDKLQLFSPAFFQTKSAKFKKLQLLSYTKSKNVYMDAFLNSCFAPYDKKDTHYKENTKEELSELLNYEWLNSEFEELSEKGVIIEVYLGEADHIIDVNGAREFFTQLATVTYIKDANHFLQVE